MRPVGFLALSVAMLAIAGLANATFVSHPSATARQSAMPEAAWLGKANEANLPEVVSHRSQLVISYCGQCHSPPPPELHSSAEWRWMIVRMDLRTWAAKRPGVRVASNEELIEIARYYEAHSGE